MDEHGLFNFALCDVESTIDTSEGYRIKVRIPGSDDPNTPIEKLPYCFPLLPKHLLVRPKNGEKVFVFFQKPNTKDTLRLFVGPIVLQDYMLDNSPGSTKDGKTLMTANSISAPDVQDNGDTTQQKLMGPFEAPSMNPENIGTLPTENAIVLRGRGNTDIVFKPDETQIRCGFKANPYDSVVKNRLKFNPVDLGYIQLKYKPAKDGKGEDYKSCINIIADRVNILSHDSSSPTLKLGDNEALISDDTMKEVYSKAHQLPYGDELVAFLKEFVRVFNEHTHPFHMEPPCLNEANTKALSINFDDLLSKTIRIN